MLFLGKLTKEQIEIKTSLDSFESILPEILHTLEFWDLKNAQLAKPFNNVEKLIKKKKKDLKSNKGSVKGPETPDVSGRTEPIEISSDIGIPCWLINRILHAKFEEVIPIFMKSTVDEEVSHEQQVIYEFKENPLLQSVLPKPKVRSVKKSEVFHITDVDENAEVYLKVKKQIIRISDLRMNFLAMVIVNN